MNPIKEEELAKARQPKLVNFDDTIDGNIPNKCKRWLGGDSYFARYDPEQAKQDQIHREVLNQMTDQEKKDLEFERENNITGWAYAKYLRLSIMQTRIYEANQPKKFSFTLTQQLPNIPN